MSQNKGCRERRQRARFYAAKKDTVYGYEPNHAGPSSFSFDFKDGEKEKYFVNGGKPIASPLNGAAGSCTKAQAE